MGVLQSRAVIVAALVVASLSLLAPVPVAAFVVSKTAYAAAASYSICSWDQRRTCEHKVATVTADVQPGYLYQVKESVTYGSLSRYPIYVMAEIACFDGATGAYIAAASLAHYQNLLSSDTSPRLTPTLVAKAPASGHLTCSIIVRGTRYYPHNPLEQYRVKAGSIAILGGVRAGSVNHPNDTSDPTGITLRTGQVYYVIVASDSLDPRWLRLDAYGELYATTQAPANASTTLTTQLVFAQYPYTSGSGFCQLVTGTVRTWTITHDRHHATLYSALAAYPREGCEPLAKVVLRIRVTHGYPVTISGNGTTLVAVAVQ